MKQLGATFDARYSGDVRANQTGRCPDAAQTDNGYKGEAKKSSPPVKERREPLDWTFTD